jgi:hypothetical protein
MKHSFPKNGVSGLRGSVLAATLDECNLRLAGIALLIILIDVVGCEILIAAGLDVELSQGCYNNSRITAFVLPSLSTLGCMALKGPVPLLL